MKNRNLIFAIDKKVNIYLEDSDNVLLEDGTYRANIKERYSLLRLLPLFERPIDEIISSLKDSRYKIENILPINELVFFLITEMRSSYWINLVCSFLLDERIHFRFNQDILNKLKDRNIIKWLPQKESHLMKKVVSKSERQGV